MHGNFQPQFGLLSVSKIANLVVRDEPRSVERGDTTQAIWSPRTAGAQLDSDLHKSEGVCSLFCAVTFCSDSDKIAAMCVAACENVDSDSYCEEQMEERGCEPWDMHQRCFKTCSGCQFSGQCHAPRQCGGWFIIECSLRVVDVSC